MGGDADVAQTADASGFQPASAKREALKRRLFKKCDKDGDGHLNKMEMKELAEDVGFEGSEEDWTEEYELLCSEHQLDPLVGIPKSIIMMVLEDKSELGLYCTDQEICQLLGEDAASPGAEGNGEEADEDEEEDEEDDNADFVRIFFAGANFSTSESALKAVFSEAGDVEEFTLFRLQDGRSMGMGRVKYASHGEAQNALDTLHKREIDGREVMVQVDNRGDDGEEGTEGKWKGKGKDKHSKDKGKGRYSGKGDYKGRSKGGKGHDDWHAYEDGGDGNGDDRTIFFAGASFDSSASFLRRQFQRAGRITQFWLFQEKSGYSRGMGVVQYQTAREANSAVDQFSGKEVGGRQLYVKVDDRGLLHQQQPQSHGYDEWDSGGWDSGPKGRGGWQSGKDWHGGKDGWSTGYDRGYDHGYHKGGKGYGKGGKRGDLYADSQSNRVFFSGAPFKASPHIVQEYFAAFGNIRSFAVFRNFDGSSRGMGVCVYQSSHSAAAAMRDGIIMDGRSLYMQEDVSQNSEEKGGWDNGYKGGGKGRSQDYDRLSQVDPNKAVFFRNVPFETAEKFLRDKFESVGAIKSFVLFTMADGRSQGKGVVEYFTATAAERAYNEIHDTIVSGRPINVDYYTTQ